MTKYVAGFVVCREAGRMALIRKARPAWQRGKLNGIGGHVEEQDKSTLAAMRREFAEETGGSEQWDWRHFLLLEGADWMVYFFVALVDEAFLLSLRGTIDEALEVHDIGNVLSEGFDIIPNLRWIIPMALDKDQVYGHIHDPS